MLVDYPFKRIAWEVGVDAYEEKKGATETRSPAKRLFQCLE